MAYKGNVLCKHPSKVLNLEHALVDEQRQQLLQNNDEDDGVMIAMAYHNGVYAG